MAKKEQTRLLVDIGNNIDNLIEDYEAQIKDAMDAELAEDNGAFSLSFPVTFKFKDGVLTRKVEMKFSLGSVKDQVTTSFSNQANMFEGEE